MPEGPEVFLAARAVHDAVAGQPVQTRFHHPALVSHNRRLAKVPIRRVHARSKAMLTEFADGTVLYAHNQLYGAWVVHARTEPLLSKQVRLVITTAAHRVVLYSATDFAWLQAGDEHKHPYIAKLGPEVLDSAVTASQLATRLANFPRRVVADALLDQHVVAGLGNYLRADILFKARVAPTVHIGALSQVALMRVAVACKQLTKRSVLRQGVVRPWATYLAARKAGADHEDARFYAFDREGLPCWTCRSPIERVTQGGRGLFYCRRCQPQPVERMGV
jgi:endonuclease VIII